MAEPQLDPSTTMPPVPPMPYPGSAATGPATSADGAVPPMPSEVSNERAQGSAPGGRFRKMMRRRPRDDA